MYLLPSPHSFDLFHGLIFVRKGHYRRAILHFTLTLPPTYPTLPPTITFAPAPPELFHPLIATTGIVDTARLEWQPGVHSLSHALAYVKKLFYKVEWWGEGEGGRREARELWKGNREEFNRRVLVCIAWSLDTLVDNGKAMHVTPPSQQHEKLWQRIAEQWGQEEKNETEQPATHGQQPAAAAAAADSQPARTAGHNSSSGGSYLQWFMPGPHCILSREEALGDAGMGRGKKIVVTVEEEREWLEEERRRRAEARKQRVDAVAGKDEGEQQDTQAEVEAEDEVHAAQYALDESVTTEEEEDLP